LHVLEFATGDDFGEVMADSLRATFGVDLKRFGFVIADGSRFLVELRSRLGVRSVPH
jgi:hypothetical protein